jgi:O-antigen ligase
VIILAQSRNAFGMVCIMLMGYYHSVIMKYKPAIKQLVMIPLVLIFLVISVRYVINTTGLGARFLNDIEEVEEETYKTQYQTGTAFDYVVGERIVYYATGWEIFKNHLWTGIGLDNYKNYMGGKFPMHVEYMKHLAEGGIIATFFWIAFLISLLRVIIKTKIPFMGKSMAYFTFGAILFTCMFSVNYGQERQMILYGIILSMSYPSAGNFFYKDIKHPESKIT